METTGRVKDSRVRGLQRKSPGGIRQRGLISGPSYAKDEAELCEPEHLEVSQSICCRVRGATLNLQRHALSCLGGTG